MRVAKLRFEEKSNYPKLLLFFIKKKEKKIAVEIFTSPGLSTDKRTTSWKCKIS